MAKGFGKFLFGAAIVGAVAAGAYYLLKSNDYADDFDDFDDDENDDLEEFLKAETEQTEKSEREYVPLNLSKEAKAADTDKVIGEPEKKEAPAENVVKDENEEAKEAKDFQFTDLNKEES